MPRRDPDPFQAALIELLRDASVDHLTLAAAADLLAAEHRMSARFTEREDQAAGRPGQQRARARRLAAALVEHRAHLPDLVAALEAFAKDRDQAALLATLEEATQLFSQAGVEEEPEPRAE